eukprot:Opistho-2@11648
MCMRYEMTPALSSYCYCRGFGAAHFLCDKHGLSLVYKALPVLHVALDVSPDLHFLVSRQEAKPALIHGPNNEVHKAGLALGHVCRVSVHKHRHGHITTAFLVPLSVKLLHDLVCPARAHVAWLCGITDVGTLDADLEHQPSVVPVLRIEARLQLVLELAHILKVVRHVRRKHEIHNHLADQLEGRLVQIGENVARVVGQQSECGGAVVVLENRPVVVPDRKLASSVYVEGVVGSRMLKIVDNARHDRREKFLITEHVIQRVVSEEKVHCLRDIRRVCRVMVWVMRQVPLLDLLQPFGQHFVVNEKLLSEKVTLEYCL